MILTPSAKGPSYSTDSTAREMTRFFATHRAPQAATPRSGVTDAPVSLEALYPALFAESQRAGFVVAVEACAAMLARTFEKLAHSRGNRNVDRASRVASAIANRYAPKA